MSVIPVELIARTPGFAGRLTKWIIQTALYKQPQLALGAALAATGTLKGQKVRSETDLRTNHLIVGLGLPSSGKGHAIKCIDKLFSEIGAEDKIAGKPASDSGLLSSLAEGKGVKLVQWDEIGIGLSKITSPKSPPSLRNILNVIMQLFSAADINYRGEQYSNRNGKNARIDLYQPCLNIFGVSTPTRFYEALNSDFGSDGFLSRLLIFESEKIHPDPVYKPEPCYVSDSLGKQARRILDEEAPTPENDLEDIDGPQVRVIKYSSQAYSLVHFLFAKYNGLKKKEKSEIIQSVHGRAMEHIIKLALTVEPQDEISRDTLLWAEEVYDHLANSLLNLLEHDVSNSDFQRNLIKIINILKDGPIDHASLTRQTQWLNRRDRNELIETLIESEKVRSYKETLGDSHKPTTFFELIK